MSNNLRNTMIFLFGITLLYLFHELSQIPISIFKIRDLGNLGDFIGGILGTLVAIIVAYYVFQTYKKDKQKAEIDIINSLYENLLKEIGSLQYKEHKGD